MYRERTSPGDAEASCNVWLASGELHRCSNEGKMRSELKLAGVPQTPEPISAVSEPKFAMLRPDVEGILLFSNLFPIVDTCLSCEDTAVQICAMVPRWRILGDFLRPVFSASRVQHISDLYSKFALRPHIGVTDEGQRGAVAPSCSSHGGEKEPGQNML